MTISRQFLKDNAPLGVGLGLRGEIFEETLAASNHIDWLEITPENYMDRGGLAQERLKRAQSVYPLVSHGVTLSLGSIDPFDEEYLKQLEILFKQINPPWFSDHLCFSSVNGTYSNDLLPLPRTTEAIEHMVKRIRYIQARFARPVLIENISYYLDYPGQKITEAQFLSEILEKSDCGLLLDVNNVYVNAQNHHEDAHLFLSEIPLERVVQLHVAGHHHYPEGLIDTHGAAICDDVWELLTWVMQRCRPLGVLLERDLDIPPFVELIAELQQIRKIWDATQLQANAPELLEIRS